MAGTYFGSAGAGRRPDAAAGGNRRAASGKAWSSRRRSRASRVSRKRQGRITTTMFICFALVETLFIFTLVFFFALKGMLPSAEPGDDDAAATKRSHALGDMPR